MEGGLIVLAAALLLFLSPDVQGTAHLAFSNNTQVNITRDGCGVSKLCVETPDNCDPSGNSCLFVSAVSSVSVLPNGVDFSVELSGESSGYIAVGVTANASEGTSMLFICAQNSSDNGKFLFRTMQMNNTDKMLTPTETRVKEIGGMVNGNMIKCEFTVPNVNASNTRSSEDTTFSVLLGNGSFDGSVFGAFNLLFGSKPLDLTKPDSNVPTTAAPTTTAPINNTTMPNNSGALQPHAVLLLLSVLTLSVLLRV
ncbi:putative ferric-chelate reductase 1 [Trematomus bernacchii]|uniref:putative ferric-chelate reductase 1 n=1 Tax=Trematomus bernacchii TaxID=40690 RepID=UPI00146E20F4|nr:putative ferric-chelate reductase 1 [Trematomus bernacchii]